MSRWVLLLLALASGAPGALGCGGGGGDATGGATCASNASCGGNVIGTWAIAQACNTTASFPTACGAETYSISDNAQTGTIVFRADGSATEMLRTTGTLHDSLPPACLTNGETCADIDAARRDEVLTGTIYTAASCSDNAGTCECTLVFDTTSNATGTYTTSGSTLTVTTNGTPNPISYCVTGSTLVMSVATRTIGGPPVVYVLTRQ
jgi:hypothetical protein